MSNQDSSRDHNMSAQARERAAMWKRHDESFAQHIVRQEIDTPDWKAWRCSRPGSWVYGFHVVTGPGFIAITGDIGDRIFRCSDRNAFAWLMGSRMSVDYVAEKCQDREPDAFSVEMALEFLAQQEADYFDHPDYLKKLKRVRSEWEESDDGRAWMNACYESGLDDPPSCSDFDFETLWCIAALQRFCALVEAASVTAERSAS